MLFKNCSPFLYFIFQILDSFIKRSSLLAKGENHESFIHSYLKLLASQLGWAFRSGTKTYCMHLQRLQMHSTVSLWMLFQSRMQMWREC
jgi:hypothetical protein